MSDLSIIKEVPYHPDQMEALKGSLSKTLFRRCVDSYESLYIKCDRNSEQDSSDKNATLIKRGRKPTVVENQVLGFFRQYASLKEIPIEVMNVLEGIARLDWYSRGDAMRKNVVAPDPIIEHSCVKPWTRVLYIKCDRNKDYCVKEGFAKPKPNLYGEYFLSPAGQTRREYLINLNKVDNNVTQLSVNTIVRILRELSEITTKEIEGLISVNERQARRYNQACKIAMPFLVKAYQRSFEIKADVLRKKFIKNMEEEELSYTEEDIELHLQGMFDQMALVSVCGRMGSALSPNYSEGISGVYVPFVGVVLENYSIGDIESFEDIEDLGIDDYLMMSDV